MTTLSDRGYSRTGRCLTLYDRVPPMFTGRARCGDDQGQLGADGWPVFQEASRVCGDFRRLGQWTGRHGDVGLCQRNRRVSMDMTILSSPND